jgi:hypothetical protein
VPGFSKRSKLVGGDVQEGEHLERKSLSHLCLMRVQKTLPLSWEGLFRGNYPSLSRSDDGG